MWKALPKVTLLVDVRARIWTQIFWFQVYTAVQAEDWAKHTSCREPTMGVLESNCSLGKQSLGNGKILLVSPTMLTELQALMRIYCVLSGQAEGCSWLGTSRSTGPIYEPGLLRALKTAHWFMSFQVICEHPKQHWSSCRRGSSATSHSSVLSTTPWLEKPDHRCADALGCASVIWSQKSTLLKSNNL